MSELVKNVKNIDLPYIKNGPFNLRVVERDPNVPDLAEELASDLGDNKDFTTGLFNVFFNNGEPCVHSALNRKYKYSRSRKCGCDPDYEKEVTIIRPKKQSIETTQFVLRQKLPVSRFISNFTTSAPHSESSNEVIESDLPDLYGENGRDASTLPPNAVLQALGAMTYQNEVVIRNIPGKKDKYFFVKYPQNPCCTQCKNRINVTTEHGYINPLYRGLCDKCGLTWIILYVKDGKIILKECFYE